MWQRKVNCSNIEASVIKKVVYREPVTWPRSPGIVQRQSAINNKLAPKPAPKPNSNPTLTLNQSPYLTLTLN